MQPSMNAMKYLLQPLVNLPFISHKLEWINSNGATSLVVAALWGLWCYFDCIHTWSLKPLTESTFGIKLILAKQGIQSTFIWHKHKCHISILFSWISWFTNLKQALDKDKLKRTWTPKRGELELLFLILI